MEQALTSLLLPHSHIRHYSALPPSLYLLIHELRSRPWVGLAWVPKFRDELPEFQKPKQNVKPSFGITLKLYPPD